MTALSPAWSCPLPLGAFSRARTDFLRPPDHQKKSLFASPSSCSLRGEVLGVGPVPPALLSSRLSSSLPHRFWFFKFLVFVGITVGAFYIPDGSFSDSRWSWRGGMEVARRHVGFLREENWWGLLLAWDPDRGC